MSRTFSALADPIGRIRTAIEAGFGFNDRGQWGQWEEGRFRRRFDGPPEWATPESFKAVKLYLSDDREDKYLFRQLETRYRNKFGFQIAESGFPPLAYFIIKGARLGQCWFK